MTDYTVGVKIAGDAAGLAKAAQDAKKSLDAMAGAGIKGLDSLNKGIQGTEKTLLGMSTRTRSEFARMAQAREVLGIRSETRIQQEILRTQAAYQRLASSGTLTWREQRRAADQMRETVGRLNNEMGVYSLRQRAVAGAQRVGTIAAGAVAGAAVVAPKAGRAFDYDMTLAHMANTAYGDPSKSAAEDRANRIAGKGELDRAIRDALKYGGGTVEGATQTLNSILSSGAFGETKDALTVFREALRAATANDADSNSFAQMAFQANKNFGIAPQDVARMFGVATFAGQSGAFEIKDMSKWLGPQMAAASQVGMSGMGGFAKLAALNQAARLTAGTADEAGNNVVNLLSKIGSDDTGKDMAKLGINYKKRIAEGRMQGQDALDVTADIVEERLLKDKNYQSAKRALATAGNDKDREAALQDVLKIAQGSTVSKMFQDRQALMALIAYIGNRGMVDKTARDSLQYGGDAVNRNMQTVEDSPAYKIAQAKQAAEMANYDAMIKLGPTVSSVADAFVDLSRKHPALAAAASGATTALSALTAAVVGSGLVGMLMGGKALGAGSLVGGAVRAVGAGVGATASGAASLVTSAGSAVTATGAALGATGVAAGGALLALPVAGAYMQDQMYRTEGGLRARIEDRNKRIAEFEQIMSLKREAGDSEKSVYNVQTQRDALVADRDAMALRLQELLANAKVGGEITVNVTTAPGIQAQASLKPNEGTRMSGNVGRTNTNTD